jgi:AraC-like DNA-binding protein
MGHVLKPDADRPRVRLATEPLVRAAVLTGFPTLAQSLGIDALAALRNAGIARDLLSDPDRRIPVLQLNRLLQETAVAAHAEAIGLRLAREIRVEHLGLLQLLTHHAATAGDVFETVCRYSQLHNEALSLWTESDGFLTVRLEYLTRSRTGVRDLIEMTAGVIGLNLRTIIGADWNPRRVCFRHDAPRDTSVHQQVFRCPVQFAADFDGLVCQSPDFDRRNRLADEGDNELMDDAWAMAARVAGDPTLPLTRRLIWALLPSGRCTANEVARLLRIDRRTLHRRLAQHDESFTSLITAARVELAARHVSLGLRRFGEIADLLGFRSQSDFSHWFRAHFELSPRQWQQAFRSGELPADGPNH